MSQEVESVATDPKQIAEVKSMSLEDFVNADVEKHSAPAGDEEESEQSEETTEEANDTQSASSEESEEAPEVLSQNEVDIGSLSDEQLEALAERMSEKGIQSRLVNRIGTLVKQRKQSDEHALSLEDQAKKAEEAILAKKAPTENNPYKEIVTIDGLQTEAARVDEFIDQLEEVVLDSEDSHADDVVTTANGKDVTKKEVKKLLRQARKDRKEYIPAQLRVIQQAAQAAQAKVAYEKQTREELPWMDQADSKTKLEYDRIMSGPVFETIRKKAPELEAYLSPLAGHAANSMFGREEISLDGNAKKPAKKRSTSITPAAAPSGASAASAQSPDRAAKQMKAMEAKFAQRGSLSIEDFVSAKS